MPANESPQSASRSAESAAPSRGPRTKPASVLLIKASRLTLPGSAMVPPLGLLYLASVLRRDGRAQVRVLDMRLSRDWKADLSRALRELEPDVVGISALTVERRAMKAIAGRIKAERPGLPVIVGGPHATSFPADCLREQAVDAVCVGEGEEIIGQLVDAAVERADLGSLRGVYTRASLPPAGPPAFAPLPDVESLPFPSWDLLRLADYFPNRSMSGMNDWKYAVMMTSRGCPYRCTFCHAIHGKRHRARSPESVLEELKTLGGLLGHGGVVEILDDTFNLQVDRAKRILQGFASTNGRLMPAFPNAVRTDLVDEETLDLMKAARSPLINFAIETGSPRIQRLIKKNLDLEKARRVIESASRRDLYTGGFFMLGFPDETREEMLETIRYACSTPLVMAHFFKVIPFPGTELWSRALESGRGEEALLDGDYLTSQFNLSAVSDRELAGICRLAFRRFYGRPTAMWRVLRRYPRLSLLPNRFVQFLAHVVKNRGHWKRPAEETESGTGGRAMGVEPS